MEYVGREARLSELGMVLPAVPSPAGSYAVGVRTGRLLFVSGQTWRVDGRACDAGVVPTEVSVERAKVVASHCALAVLAEAKAVMGSLEHIAKVVRVAGYVRSASGFGEQPAVVNGASDLFLQVFGDAGVHARTSVGVAELPGGAPVEIDAIFELRSRAPDSSLVKSEQGAV